MYAKSFHASQTLLIIFSVNCWKICYIRKMSCNVTEHGNLRMVFTSRVSLPLLSSSWMFSSARLRACSSAWSLCFRVYWSQRKARAIWENATWDKNSSNLSAASSKMTLKQKGRTFNTPSLKSSTYLQILLWHFHTVGKQVISNLKKSPQMNEIKIAILSSTCWGQHALW